MADRLPAHFSSGRGPQAAAAAPSRRPGWPAANEPRRPLRRSLVALALAAAAAAALLQAAAAAAAFAQGRLPERGLQAADRRDTSLAQRRAEALAVVATRPGAGKRLLVLGGNGYVGREVCRLAVQRGYLVSSLSRRGENPEPGSEELSAVRWVKGDAADASTVRAMVAESEAVVHAVGLLFDAKSGLEGLNIIVSGSKSVPTEESTYDRTTRQTAFNLIEAVRSQFRLPFWKPTPVLFVSAAEAGWPEVQLGPEVENIAPAWLKEYLVAKRAVEAEIRSSPGAIRPVIFRPSLIWSWTKFDVLPVIPIFNLLNFLGVPFVDKTVTVSTLAKAIIAGLEDEGVSGVQRFPEMEALERRVA